LPDVIKYLPYYYRTSQVMANVASAEDAELLNFQARLKGTLDQFFIDSATDALEKWEIDLGIPIENNKPPQYRRSVIKARLRGTGTVTLALIKNTAASYTEGNVEIIEDNSNNQFTIKFVGTVGIPPNMDDLKKTIEDIKPAHLFYSLEYTYNTYNTLSLFSNSYLSAYTYSQLRQEEVI